MLTCDIQQGMNILISLLIQPIIGYGKTNIHLSYIQHLSGLLWNVHTLYDAMYITMNVTMIVNYKW